MTDEGKVIPQEIIWDNGKHYKIDKVTEVRRAASTKAGGVGVRFSCRILGQERFLYIDEYTWFIEI